MMRSFCFDQMGSCKMKSGMGTILNHRVQPGEEMES